MTLLTGFFFTPCSPFATDARDTEQLKRNNITQILSIHDSARPMLEVSRGSRHSRRCQSFPSHKSFIHLCFRFSVALPELICSVNSSSLEIRFVCLFCLVCLCANLLYGSPAVSPPFQLSFQTMMPGWFSPPPTTFLS